MTDRISSSKHSKFSYENCTVVKTKERDEEIFEDKTFVCDTCGLRFHNKFSLTMHVTSHSQLNSEVDKQDFPKDRQNICSICKKKFTAKKNLLKHLRDVHKNFEEAEQMVVKKNKCPERHCNFMFRMMKEVREHIEKFHGIRLLKDLLEFTSETEFLKWKKEEESNTVSWFVTNRKKTTLSDGTKKQTFFCHRTGHYNPKGFGKYRMKSVGSCKTGVTCPASVEVTEHLDGQFSVIYHKTHLGHEQDVVYMKLSKEEREQLAGKIEQGFTFDAILEDVKESNDSSKEVKKRIQLLSKKDLYSIKKSVNNTYFKKFKKENSGSNKNESTKPEAQNSYIVKSNESDKNFDCQPKLTLYPSHGVTYPQENVTLGSSPLLCQKLGKEGNISLSAEGVPSQIVILSPEIDYTSVAEIILLPSGNTTHPQPGMLPQYQKPQPDQEITGEPNPEERNRMNRANLRVQLKEKIDKISEFLPKSEFLTPKQFDLINSKLDGILNIFNEAHAKAKSKKQNLRKRVKKGKGSEADWQLMGAARRDGKVEEVLAQQVYQTPLLYTVYN